MLHALQIMLALGCNMRYIVDASSNQRLQKRRKHTMKQRYTLAEIRNGRGFPKGAEFTLGERVSENPALSEHPHSDSSLPTRGEECIRLCEAIAAFWGEDCEGPIWPGAYITEEDVPIRDLIRAAVGKAGKQ